MLLLSVVAHGLEAGSAKVDMTPPLGTPLNGYFDRLGRGAMAVHDPLWVRCLYLDDGDTRLFLVTADLCVTNRELRDRVLELAPADVPKENIILTATHTHNGHGAMIREILFRNTTGRFMPDVLEATAQHYAEAMKAAYDARKRATIGYTTFDQDDLSVNRREKGGPIDRQVGVIRVEDSDGNAIALVANMAAHPTSVGGKEALSFSADYPGFFYTEVEKQTAPGCVAMFMNGTEGNQRCTSPDDTGGWERTAAVGRLLAERALEASQSIRCDDAPLHVGYAEPRLPLSIAGALMPTDTVLHTLEIGGLFMAFWPGEPCVELGLALRNMALARGYNAQFSAGLADDHLLYFAPRSYYHTLYYETGMSLYGPDIGDWFHRQFAALMTRGEQPPEESPPPAATIEDLGGGVRLRLSGSAYEIGYQRGAAYRETLQKMFQDTIVAPCDSGAYIPDTGWWKNAPGFVNLTTLALPRLAMGARPMLTGIGDVVYDETAGMADGAGLPFDAAWLIQCAGILAEQDDISGFYRSPFCTMFAAIGDRAGADDLLVGRNLDWTAPEPPVLLEVSPESGHRYISIGFPWNVGTFSGMNDAGLVVCAERVEARGTPSLDGPPVEFVLRRILQEADSLDSALTTLTSATHLRGYHVLLADPALPSARVIELGEEPIVRRARDGLLPGIDPEAEGVPPDAAARYARLISLGTQERIIAPGEVRQILSDAEPGQVGQAKIFNELTRHSVVFEPKARRLHVAFPKEDGRPGAFSTVAFGDGAEGEAP
jgi:Neutral/alkaline non-lysosomal ceramidase, N-terminal/Acyl-coenzyme A:6-aminopenicillanic acid acyl-transferase